MREQIRISGPGWPERRMSSKRHPCRQQQGREQKKRGDMVRRSPEKEQ